MQAAVQSLQGQEDIPRQRLIEFFSNLSCVMTDAEAQMATSLSQLTGSGRTNEKSGVLQGAMEQQP